MCDISSKNGKARGRIEYEKNDICLSGLINSESCRILCAGTSSAPTHKVRLNSLFIKPDIIFSYLILSRALLILEFRLERRNRLEIRIVRQCILTNVLTILICFNLDALTICRNYLKVSFYISNPS